MTEERIAQFILDASAGDFERLALAAFEHQYEAIEPIRRLADRRGRPPDQIHSWNEIPAIPTQAFKSLEINSAPAKEIFRSSGTGGERSEHHHPFPDLYRAAVDHSFPANCLPGLHEPPMLSLIPSREDLPDSSLSFMVDHVMTRFGGADCRFAIGKKGVEAAAARGWLASRQRDRAPGLVLATSFALVDLIATLRRLDLRFRLPTSSVIFETGGYKGRTRAVLRAELLADVNEFLGVPPQFVVREYGMTELSSQLYSSVLRGGDPDVFEPPHWVRVRVLDPVSMEPATEGSQGLIAILDLANVGSAVHVLTQDLGVQSGSGVRLTGRASGAELRGCSLTVEEMSG